MCDEAQEKGKGFGFVVCLFWFFFLAITKICSSKGQNYQTLCCSLY